MTGETKLLRNSTFSGICYHEVLLFSGLVSLFLLFVYCFLSNFRKAFPELRVAPFEDPFTAKAHGKENSILTKGIPSV